MGISAAYELLQLVNEPSAAAAARVAAATSAVAASALVDGGGLLGRAADARSSGTRVSAAVVSGPRVPKWRCVYEAQKRSCPEQYGLGGGASGATSRTAIVY